MTEAEPPPELSAGASADRVVVTPRTINPHRSKPVASDEPADDPAPVAEADEPAGANEREWLEPDDVPEEEPFLGPVGMFRSAIVIACLPIIASVAWAISHGEWFAGDRSIMGVFTQDVFSRHTPLLGTVSTMGNYSGAEQAGSVHHLGPAQFWALSIPNLVLRGHPAGLLIGALIVNCAAVIITAVFVRRRLGYSAAVGALLVCTILAYGLGPSLLRDIWTPFLGLWPLLALVVLTWSLIDGDRRALPWAALVSGFLAQIELMFVGPALVLTVCALAGFFLRRRSDRLAYQQAVEDGVADAEDAPEAPRPLGWTLISCEIIALFMWWPIIYDELTGDPGNLTLLIRALDHGTDKAGAEFVRHNMVAQLQMPPVWVQRAVSPFDVGQPPSFLTLASAVLFTGLMITLTVWAWRRRRAQPTIFAMMATCYPILLGAFVNLSITPAAGTIGLQYRRWLWPFGAFLWFAVIVAGVTWARERSWTAWVREKVQPATATLVLLALAAVMVIPACIGQLTPPSDDVRANQQVTSMWNQLRDRLPEKSTYLSVGGADAAFGIGPEIMRRLVVDGYTMRTSTFGADSYGTHRVLSKDRPADQTLQLITGKLSIAPPDTPRKLLAAGTVDGSSAEDYVLEADEILQRVRGGPGIVLQDDARQELIDDLGREGGPDPGKVDGMLADPTRGMFSAQTLEMQLDGRAVSSPLSDEEARTLLKGMGNVGVLAFLRDAPEIPKS